MFCFVDHFEPGWRRPPVDVERARVRRWREQYPRLCEAHRDADGRPPIHTFFYPEEEYRREHLDALTELCRMGMAEIEIHLHHDNDTSDNLRNTLRTFTRKLVDVHDRSSGRRVARTAELGLHSRQLVPRQQPSCRSTLRRRRRDHGVAAGGLLR
jgi:hypothetical protein